MKTKQDKVKECLCSSYDHFSVVNNHVNRELSVNDMFIEYLAYAARRYDGLFKPSTQRDVLVNNPQREIPRG